MWKVSYVTPVYIEGGHLQFSNDKSIALTCIVCKIIEIIK